MDIQAEIATLDTKIADAKTYLKKLRQYKRTLAKIQAEQAAVTELEATAKAEATAQVATTAIGPQEKATTSTPLADSIRETILASRKNYSNLLSITAELVASKEADLTAKEEALTAPVAQEEAVTIDTEATEVVEATAALPADTTTNVVEFKAKEDDTDYSTLGIRALRLLCRDKGIKGAARLTKNQCLEALTAARAA